MCANVVMFYASDASTSEWSRRKGSCCEPVPPCRRQRPAMFHLHLAIGRQVFKDVTREVYRKCQRIPCFCDARHRSILIYIIWCMCKWSNAVSSPFQLFFLGEPCQVACITWSHHQRCVLPFWKLWSRTKWHLISTTGSELLGSQLSLPSGCCGRWNWLWKNNTVSQLYLGGRLGCVGGRVHGSGSLVDCLSAEIIQSLRLNGVGCGSFLKCNSIDSQKRTRWAPMRSPTAWRQPLQKVEGEKCQLFALSRLAARSEKIWWLNVIEEYNVDARGFQAYNKLKISQTLPVICLIRCSHWHFRVQSVSKGWQNSTPMSSFPFSISVIVVEPRPRRIAAVGVATRVAEERGGKPRLVSRQSPCITMLS